MLTIIVSFFIGLTTDLVWTFYFRNIALHKALASANWSVGIYLCGVFSTWLLIDKAYFAMIAYVIGGWLGTYFAVKYGVTNDVSLSAKSNSLPFQ